MHLVFSLDLRNGASQPGDVIKLQQSFPSFATLLVAVVILCLWPMTYGHYPPLRRPPPHSL